MKLTVSFLVFLLSRWAEQFITLNAHSKATHYNAIRLIRFAALLIIEFIAITMLFSNWYTAAVSLGLISLVLGFALQTPILSLIGWFYIVIRKPYQVGNRIQYRVRSDVNFVESTLGEVTRKVLGPETPNEFNRLKS